MKYYTNRSQTVVGVSGTTRTMKFRPTSKKIPHWPSASTTFTSFKSDSCNSFYNSSCSSHKFNETIEDEIHRLFEKCIDLMILHLYKLKVVYGKLKRYREMVFEMQSLERLERKESLRRSKLQETNGHEKLLKKLEDYKEYRKYTEDLFVVLLNDYLPFITQHILNEFNGEKPNVTLLDYSEQCSIIFLRNVEWIRRKFSENSSTYSLQTYLQILQEKWKTIDCDKLATGRIDEELVDRRAEIELNVNTTSIPYIPQQWNVPLLRKAKNHHFSSERREEINELLLHIQERRTTETLNFAINKRKEKVSDKSLPVKLNKNKTNKTNNNSRSQKNVVVSNNNNNNPNHFNERHNPPTMIEGKNALSEMRMSNIRTIYLIGDKSTGSTELKKSTSHTQMINTKTKIMKERSQLRKFINHHQNDKHKLPNIRGSSTSFDEASSLFLIESKLVNERNDRILNKISKYHNRQSDFDKKIVDRTNEETKLITNKKSMNGTSQIIFPSPNPREKKKLPIIPQLKQSRNLKLKQKKVKTIKKKIVSTSTVNQKKNIPVLNLNHTNNNHIRNDNNDARGITSNVASSLNRNNNNNNQIKNNFHSNHDDHSLEISSINIVKENKNSRKISTEVLNNSSNSCSVPYNNVASSWAATPLLAKEYEGRNLTKTKYPETYSKPVISAEKRLTFQKTFFNFTLDSFFDDKQLQYMPKTECD
ncbi:hypothetical protein SNEBB_002328 [Seison nebaliae]|nr:hypothetical protein SNEBB_002328 [Seison nebaliae]